MSERPRPEPSDADARSVMAGGIQSLFAAAARPRLRPPRRALRRGRLRMVGSTADGWILAGGALASGAALLAYGLAVVQDVLARPRRVWRSLAPVGVVFPAFYGLYVVGWRGLRGLAVAAGALGLGTAILYAVLGAWVLRSWLRVVEIRRLARVMTESTDEPLRSDPKGE